MINFKKWLEGLTEPPAATMDPANLTTFYSDQDDTEANKDMPMGMRIHRGTTAFAELKPAWTKKKRIITKS